MRTSVFTIAALAACALVSGCMTAGIGDRSIGRGLDDTAAASQVRMRLMAPKKSAAEARVLSTSFPNPPSSIEVWPNGRSSMSPMPILLNLENVKKTILRGGCCG
jgi:hypothetical protein